MDILPDTSNPYPFTEADLHPDRVINGVDHAVQAFEYWRDNNGDLIAEHVNGFTNTIDATARQHSGLRRLGQLLLPATQKDYSTQSEREFVEYFGLHNVAEKFSTEHTEFLRQRIHAAGATVRNSLWRRGTGHDFLPVGFSFLEKLAPELQGLPEMGWLESRVRHLRTILPEKVLQAGALSKVLRTIMGVATIALYDTADAPSNDRRSHLQQIIPGAYALGATYALVDDILQSNTDTSIKDKDKNRYHEVILHSLATGEVSEFSHLPDHPLTDELNLIYRSLLANYPFKSYQHLYGAIESMYQAQLRDARLSPAMVEARGGIRSMYPDMAIKAAMTRVVANIIARKAVSDTNYTKFLNGFLGSQLKDDFDDRESDKLDGNCTPFTVPFRTESGDTNPLYDLFACNAYVRHALWGGNPDISARYMRFGAEYGPPLAQRKEYARRVLQEYPHTPEIGRFIMQATTLTTRQARKALPFDMVLQSDMTKRLRTRPAANIDPRTFLADRLDYINDAVGGAIETNTVLDKIARYSLEAGGKRIRPGLTLMLAESLGVPYGKITPLLQSLEMMHTSSLIFDDLPAQDDSSTRRGRATAHVAFSEWGAQLTGISMMSRAYGVLAKLSKDFPKDRILTLVDYTDSILGFSGLCLGQMLDLDSQDSKDTTLANILEMYRLKTSIGIEAALVPLMILTGRSQQEINYIKDYSYHAGIVFQIKDDILDATASTEQIGKDTQNDTTKVNVVRSYGVKVAEELLAQHLQAAADSLSHLPFNTNLLKSVVEYFSTRRK